MYENFKIQSSVLLFWELLYNQNLYSLKILLRNLKIVINGTYDMKNVIYSINIEI